MENQENPSDQEPQDIYLKYFSDVSDFMDTHPMDFLSRSCGAISDRVTITEQFVRRLREHPNIDEVSSLDLSENVTLKDTLDLILDGLHVVSVILRTAHQYRNAYDRGELTYKEDE